MRPNAWTGFLQWVKRRMERREAKKPSKPFVCPECKTSESLTENCSTQDEFCGKCQLHWDHRFFMGWNVGWRECSGDYD